MPESLPCTDERYMLHGKELENLSKQVDRVIEQLDNLNTKMDNQAKSESDKRQTIYIHLDQIDQRLAKIETIVSPDSIKAVEKDCAVLKSKVDSIVRWLVIIGTAVIGAIVVYLTDLKP